MGEVDDIFEDPSRAPVAARGGWFPDLNVTQQQAWDDPSPYMLLYGEKGTGKSIIMCHKAVRHCYENKNALALLVTPSVRTGKFGILNDLEELVLPAWRDGNKYPEWLDGKPHPMKDQYMDDGMGLDWIPSKLDPQTKDRVLKIGNMHGGWSTIVLVSIPYAEVVESRIKAMSPSFIGMDELTNMIGDEFFASMAAQLKRRRGITGPQQYVATCNPEGPSHWVYKRFFMDCQVDYGGKICQDGMMRDPDYSVYHAKITENIHRLPPGYREHLEKLFKDPIQRRRLLDGEWIDQPTGLSIFKDHWDPSKHVKGDVASGQRVRPIPGVPIICGYDPGTTNFSVHFMQLIPIKGGEKLIWSVFDEVNFVGQTTSYRRVVSEVLKRITYWTLHCKTKFSWEHVGDEAAFNQRRENGSFDAAEIERLSGGVIKLRACPKGKHSVPARVRMVQQLLADDCLFVSCTCTKTIEMFTLIASDRPKDNKYDPNLGLTPKKSKYVHAFDSMSYPMFKYSLMPWYGVQQETVSKSGVFRCGQK